MKERKILQYMLLGEGAISGLLILTLNSSIQKEMKLIPNFNDEYNQ